jgi:hypothetical protein
MAEGQVGRSMNRSGKSEGSMKHGILDELVVLAPGTMRLSVFFQITCPNGLQKT